MVVRTATCACGQLRVTCTGEPVKVSLCHCLECQKPTGSTYGVAAFFARSQIQADGTVRMYRRGSDSGFAVTFNFCPDCGSTVFWEHERKPNEVAVAVGSFVDPDFPAPTQSAHDERRHGWVLPEPYRL
jgi:hypothetical protein